MYPFAKEAAEELKTLSDLLTLATSSFKEVLLLYQEDHHSQNTSVFFGILKMFSVAYAVRSPFCSWSDTHTSCRKPRKRTRRWQSAKMRSNGARRWACFGFLLHVSPCGQAHDERKREAQVAKEAMEADNDDRRIADDLLGKLREGNLRTGRKARKKRSSVSVSVPKTEPLSGTMDDPALIAQDLLKELHGDAFEMTTSPPSKASPISSLPPVLDVVTPPGSSAASSASADDTDTA
jgi:hypothetical protein